jgi:uncharacterized protein with von Willebrand factor type A (vWA) domain
MKGCLVEDYKNPVYRSLARGVLSNFLLENKKLPLAVALDSSIVHYKPWSQIVFNPHIREGWKVILENYYNTDNYKNLNNAIAGDSLLSKYATIHFLNSLFKKSEEELKKEKPQLSEEDKQNPIEGLINFIDTQVSKGNSYKAQNIIQKINQEMENEAKEILQDVQAIESFSHVGIPVANLLEKPDEFREKARNKIIVYLVKFLQKLRREAPSLKQAKAPTLIGGRPLGVKKIQRFSELSRVLPIDYLDDDLLTYKVASKTVRVSESYGSIQNYVVYLDKSGSMIEDIKYVSSPTQTEYVPKISFASASALALAHQLKKIGAKMTLKLFDVEVHDPITDYVQLIDTLTKIRADSGTNISNVLEDAIKFRDEKIIVITDGIDEVSEKSIKKAKSSNLDITFIFIKTDNSLLKKNFPCIYLKEAKPEVLLQI